MTNLIITHYLTSASNPQGDDWKAEKWRLNPLLDSITGAITIVMHDCFEEEGSIDDREWVKVDKTNAMPPTWRKMYLTRNYLDDVDCEYVWIVDSTDVEMFNPPWTQMEKGTLYVGDEVERLNHPWMFARHIDPRLNDFFSRHGDLRLLNSGLIGGDKETVKSFLDLLLSLHTAMWATAGETNMGLFNYAVRNFIGPIDHGRKVNTLFRAEEPYTPECWWKHK